MPSPPPLVPAPPAYSKRLWYGDVYSHAEAALGVGEPLTIYVELRRSTFAEDWPTERDIWQRNRAFPSECYSVVEPEGEYGMTPLSEVVEITEAEFRGALAGFRSRGFSHRRDG